MPGWSKGVLFLNGVNLGWYWPKVGPQMTMYIPGPFLHEGENELILLELEDAPSEPTGMTSQPVAHGLPGIVSQCCIWGVAAHSRLDEGPQSDRALLQVADALAEPSTIWILFSGS